MRTTLTLLLAFLYCLTHAQPCCVLYVDADAAGANTGASWADAYASLQDAIDAAEPGYQIWVAAGLYRPSKDPNGNPAPSNDRLKTFFIKEDIKLLGGFAGHETSPGQRNRVGNPAILSGDIGEPGVHSDNAYHVLWINGVSAAASVDGFIIEHGYANGSGSSNHDIGAGLYINGDNSLESSPVFVNCIFRDNYCSYPSGAAVYVAARWDGTARPVFRQCQFVQGSLFSRSLVRHYARARGVCEPVYSQCTFSRSAEPSGDYEITNHVEFAAPSATTVSMEGYNTIIWNNQNAISTYLLFSSAKCRADLAHCLTDTLGARVYTVNSIIHQNPLFASLETLDLRLLPGSPAVGAGSNAYADTLTLDLGLQERVVGGTVDLGVFEFQEGCINGPVIGPDVAATPPSCFDSSDGSLALSVSGGIPPYAILWNTGQQGAAIGNLAAGNYTATVTDANGCAAISTAEISAPPALLPEVAVVPPLCAGQSGEAAASGSGGTPPYQFLWSNGQSGPAASGLEAGTHAVAITDAQGCMATETLAIDEPPVLQLDVLSAQPAGCNGQGGQAAVQALGGTPPYSYQWSSGQSGPQAVSLAPGTHFATVTDGNGCEATAEVPIGSAEPLALQPALIHHPSCSSSDDGQIELAIAGGTPPFAFAWGDGQQGAVAAGLSAGLHFVTVTDGAGCLLADSFLLQAAYPFMIGINLLSPVFCQGDSTAAARAAPIGGAGPFSYLWNTGQTSEEIANLPAGSYFVTITDANGCAVHGGVMVPDPPMLQAAVAAVSPASCPEAADGSAAVEAFGGTPGYAYQWSDGQSGDEAEGLQAGEYFVAITDAHGCRFGVSLAVPSDAFEPNLDITQDGNSLTVAEEGVLYHWFDCNNWETIPGATGQSYDVAASGAYAVIVTSSSGACRDTSECLVISDAKQAILPQQAAAAFPNPNDGHFTLSLPWAAEALLYDASGRLLLREDYGPGSHPVRIDELPAGVYVLALKGAEGAQVLRLIRE